jgi:hypothetical protein
VFEYLSGGTLADFLKVSGPLDLDSLLRYGRQICRGLSHLHEKGLVHRDVAPKNVLLDERQTAHLGDFDSAVRLDEVGSGALPDTENPFAAPEELDARSCIDYRSDLYSFGCVLYLMAIGSNSKIFVQDLRVRRPDLPTSFADLVDSLLAESPEDRPKDAGAVLLWLEDIRNASNIDAIIRNGESQQVEFKASLLQPQPSKRTSHAPADSDSAQKASAGLKRALEIEVTKTVAAFLNSEGGILLIGVDDEGKIIGIEPDLALVKGHTLDSWMLALQTVIVNDLGADAFSAIRVSLVAHEDVHVAVVSCPRRDSATWHGKAGDEIFYLRTGNGTRTLGGPGLIKYVNEHWGAGVISTDDMRSSK